MKLNHTTVAAALASTIALSCATEDQPSTEPATCQIMLNPEPAANCQINSNPETAAMCEIIADPDNLTDNASLNAISQSICLAERAILEQQPQDLCTAILDIHDRILTAIEEQVWNAEMESPNMRIVTHHPISWECDHYSTLHYVGVDPIDQEWEGPPPYSGATETGFELQCFDKEVCENGIPVDTIPVCYFQQVDYRYFVLSSDIITTGTSWYGGVRAPHYTINYNLHNLYNNTDDTDINLYFSGVEYPNNYRISHYATCPVAEELEALRGRLTNIHEIATSTPR